MFVDDAAQYHSPAIDGAIVEEVLEAFGSAPRPTPLLVHGWQAPVEDGLPFRIAARLFPTRQPDVVLLDVVWVPDPWRTRSTRHVLTLAEADEHIASSERLLRQVGATPLPAARRPRIRVARGQRPRTPWPPGVASRPDMEGSR